MKKTSVILTALAPAVFAVCAIMVSCKTPSIKAPVPKQGQITEAPPASTPAGEITETDEPDEKALVFHTEPNFIPEETVEPEQAGEPELADQPEQPAFEPPPLLAELPPQLEMPPAIPPAEVTPTPAPQATVPPPAPPTPPPPVPPAAAPPVQASEPEPPPPQEQEEPLPPERPSLAIPDMPFQPVTVIPEPAEKDLAYSRTVRAVIGQYIEIPFRGAGWVYLGEFGSRRGINYDSRRMEPEGMTFLFRAEAEGTYSLKFNRQDFIHDRILNDYVKVIVEQPPEITGSSWANPQLRPDRVYAAPRWPTAVDPEGTARTSPERNTEQSAAPTGGQAASAPAATAPAATAPAATAPAASAPAATAPAATAPATTAPAATAPAASAPAGTAPAAASYADLLKNAREEYNAGRIAGALRNLDQFMKLYPGGSDEAYWLYGQSLEANNEATRDIRLALDYYRRLVREFPQSSHYNEARRRIAYLERFYFNIQ